MKIPGYSNWLTVFRSLRWLVPLAEQAYDVAGIFLAADTPLPDETVRLLHRIAGELGEQTDLLRALTSQTSAPRRLLHSPKPEDAAEGPPPIASDSVSGGGHPNVEDIVDEYWTDDLRLRLAAENARLRGERDLARGRAADANARANAGRLAP